MSEAKNKSYLWVGVRLFLVLLVIFLIGNGYAALRMQLTKMEMFRVARQLGFTDESLLRVGHDLSHVSIVTGSTLFSLHLYYETDVNKKEIENSLMKMDSSTSVSYGNYDREWERFIERLERDNNTPSKQHHQVNAEYVYAWDVLGRRQSVVMYEITKTNQQLENKKHLITGNLVHITLMSGPFPWWTRPGVYLWATFYDH